jgi:hypothetical protein
MKRRTRGLRPQAAGYRPTYSMAEELMASPIHPLPQVDRTRYLLPILDGLRALDQDAEPTPDNWRALTDAVNLMETLVAMGACAPDEAGLLNEASQAMGQAAMRHLREGVALRVAGSGLSALQAVLDSFVDAMEQLPARTMVRCYRQTEKRIAAIQRVGAGPQDVVVAL